MIYLIFILLWRITTALPQGAPTLVCQTMLPNHGGGIPPQEPPSPFVVTTIRRDTDVVVTIKTPIDLTFQGFMLQARGTDGHLLGRFQPITPGIHTINCDGEGDTVTHDNTDKKAAISAYWFAPDGFQGTVIFNATVAQNYATFWVGVEATPIEITKQSLPTNFTVQPYQTTTRRSLPTTTPYFTPSADFGERTETKDPFYEGCSEVKNCFGSPAGCIDTQDCLAAVSVTVRGDQYFFEMKAKNGAKWVGVGLSDDVQMGDDSVIECVNEGSSVKAYMSRTTPRPNLGVTRLKRPQAGIQLLNGTSADDTIFCRVQRDTVTDVDGVEYDLAKSKYNLLVAAGSRVRRDSVAFHDLVSAASSDSIFLSEITDIVSASKLLLRLHGALMVIAWLGTASVGTLLARYYRKTWVGRTLLGKDLWFAWHRNLMVLTWALTTIAFILIFVELKAWSTESNPHAVLGVIVTALCFIQPIGAYFRPHPGTPRRPIFNWAHWFGGNTAFILAIVTIFFAVRLNKAELPEWFDWILVAFVVFHVIMHVVLSIISCVSDKSSEERGINTFAMKELNGSKKMNHMVSADAPYTTSRKGLLALYISGIVVLIIALVVIIAIAPIQ